MDLDDNETRLLLCLEALCDSLFRDDEWAEFRRDCCELDVEQWHSLNSVLGEELGDIWMTCIRSAVALVKNLSDPVRSVAYLQSLLRRTYSRRGDRLARLF